MSEQIPTPPGEYSRTKLPVVGKTVFRMGVAGSYGIDSSDIRWAVEHGVNYWLWGRGFGKVTDGIREVIRHEREQHVVGMLGWGFFGWQVRRGVEDALRKLGTDYLDVFKLGWLGRTSIYSAGIIDTLLKLKRERKILSIGTSIHDRKRAGRLALDSEIDLFMIRYNAKHPGAEQDIFPHLSTRNPAVVGYTALAWGQLKKPDRAEHPPCPLRIDFFAGQRKERAIETKKSKWRCAVRYLVFGSGGPGIASKARGRRNIGECGSSEFCRI